MNPSIGRIVRYLVGDGSEWPAMITKMPTSEEDPPKYGLTIFTDEGPQYKPDVEQVSAPMEGAEAGKWRWPSVEPEPLPEETQV
jgi:hypothetical protein